ncbi:MAG: MotA/TolQ/ExbB proton channel family protein, partial [Candidatus Omnitrophica bacterium]|nr:MotA/TolQ/ExbB proton channel family protein [Candidatus Omnitrophota bacterium]
LQGGAGKPTLLAAGISKALVTTAFGLIVAIPAMVLFYYFKGKGVNLINKAELVVEDFFEIIYPTKSELAKEIAALSQLNRRSSDQSAQPAAPPVPPGQQPPQQ